MKPERETERLIAQLTVTLAPVRRLARPAVRLGRWLAVSMPAAAVVAWGFGLRPDLAARLSEPGFWLTLAAALLTALVAAYAALCAVLPDTPDWKLWLPLAPLALWLGVLGRQCLLVAVTAGPAGLRVTTDAMCLPAITLGGIVPAAAMVVLLRRSRGVRATHACLCGGLAAAALGAAALRLYHRQDAAIMVLVWQVGSVVLLSLLAAMAGRRILGRAAAPRRVAATL